MKNRKTHLRFVEPNIIAHRFGVDPDERPSTAGSPVSKPPRRGAATVATAQVAIGCAGTTRWPRAAEETQSPETPIESEFCVWCALVSIVLKGEDG